MLKRMLIILIMFTVFISANIKDEIRKIIPADYRILSIEIIKYKKGADVWVHLEDITGAALPYFQNSLALINKIDGKYKFITKYPWENTFYYSGKTWKYIPPGYKPTAKFKDSQECMRMAPGGLYGLIRILPIIYDKKVIGMDITGYFLENK
jgi:hypothetical protein